MVKINRTPLPKGVLITKESDYRGGVVFEQLKNDFYGKCYICEDKPTKINIDHRIAHGNDDDLKYDYENLFFSCAHCNGIKTNSFNDIINCTQEDPEEYFSLEILPEVIQEVSVKGKKGDIQTKNTVILLEKVYNGSGSAMSKMESETLREKILKKLLEFQVLVSEYFSEFDEDLKEAYRRRIRRIVSRNEVFAAFSRELVRKNDSYMYEFEKYLE